jgi:predicted O-methyltransferase YrrM
VPTDAELLSNVQSLRRQLRTVGPRHLRAEGDFERVSIPDADGDTLRDLLLASNVQTVIEIGLAYGSSALAIAEALISQGAHGKNHVIIDAYQDRFGDAGWNIITDAGLTEVCHLLRERSQLALPRLVADTFRADAAFVDGSHMFHNVFVDLYFLWELVRPGGLVVLDDYHWPSVATAVRYFEINVGWQQEPIHHETRLRAYRLPDPRLEPGFEDFKPFALEHEG